MEIQLRVVLLVIGLLILCGVAIDFFRRRPQRQGISEEPLKVINNNELLRSIAGSKYSTPQPAAYIADDYVVDDYPVDDYAIADSAVLDEPFLYEAELQEEIAELPLGTSEIEKETAPQPLLDDIIVIHVMSRVRGGFDGDELYKAISNAHFYLGNNNLFYRHENDDGTGAPLFSLVKAVEPGYFDIELLPRQRVPGITLLLIPSQVQDPLFALDKLVRAAKQIAFVLNGELLDHTRQALTLTTIEKYKQKIRL